MKESIKSSLSWMGNPILNFDGAPWKKDIVLHAVLVNGIPLSAGQLNEAGRSARMRHPAARHTVLTLHSTASKCALCASLIRCFKVSFQSFVAVFVVHVHPRPARRARVDIYAYDGRPPRNSRRGGKLQPALAEEFPALASSAVHCSARRLPNHPSISISKTDRRASLRRLPPCSLSQRRGRRGEGRLIALSGDHFHVLYTRTFLPSRSLGFRFFAFFSPLG